MQLLAHLESNAWTLCSTLISELAWDEEQLLGEGKGEDCEKNQEESDGES